MTERAAYTASEEQAVRAAAAGDGTARCPRCDVPMVRKRIGGGSFGLGYHRQRLWLLCPTCRRSVVFDAERGTRT